MLVEFDLILLTATQRGASNVLFVYFSVDTVVI